MLLFSLLNKHIILLGLIRNTDTTTKVYANPIFRMPLTEAKKKNIQATNASIFYRGTD